MNEQKVQLLDQNTANQIAAGEVVEKPASVVKELVENSLDAGADNIEVTIFGGGTEYIRVVDNGSGMSEENAKLAVLRHATSKIRVAEDLLHLNTLGFRGEALPSIASVSNFQLLTRPVTEEFATSIKIEGGDQADLAATFGSLQHLFFNVPARRKFLRTVQTESRYISELITKLALSRPDVRFKLVSNDKEVLSTPGNGDLVDTVKALYGKNVSEELLTVDFADSEVKVRGFIGKPTLLKGTRQWQTLLVNGRIITNRMIAKAIDHAYQSQIPKSGFPFAVLNITVESEIKFSDDSTVYKAMYKALTDALTRPMSAKPQGLALLDDSELQVFKSAEAVVAATEPSIVVETPAAETKVPETELPTLKTTETNISTAKAEVYSAYKSQQQSVWKEPEYTYRPPKTEPVYTISETRDVFDKQDNIASNIIDFTDTDSGVDTIWPLGQIDRTFIVAQSDDSLFLVDQHAAHERILYDKLVASHNDIPAQQMLIPLYIDVTAQDVNLIEEHREEFLRLGVDIEAAGESMLRVSSLPSDIKADDAEDFVREITQMLSELRTINPSDLRQNILHMTACKAAIKAGEVLNMRQMRQLIIDLCNTEHPFTCPHGRPCMVEINSAELYKMFKRT